MRSRIAFILILLAVITGLTQRSFASYTDISSIDLTSALEKVIDDKLYVKAGTVHVAPEGIFLCINEQMIPISQIEADEEGVFIKFVGWPRCPLCKYPLTPWGTCNNPDCPTNK